jgi:CubicO group peptidase (beta-lactamase class C family)
VSAGFSGYVASGFEAVAEAFAGTFGGSYAGWNTGGALAVLIHGRPVLDIWGGVADVRTERPWDQDTATVMFSSTKGLVAIMAARLVQEGRLDYNARVTDYWPEYGVAGKEDTLVRHLLSHQAGLPAPRPELTDDDLIRWDTVVSSLAGQTPLWTPGTDHAYHGLTYGWLVGEVIRRITGQSVGQYLRTLITGPLDADAWIGIPDPEQSRVAFLTEEPPIAERPLPLTGEVGGMNDPKVRAAEVPASNGIATARALATIWSAAFQEVSGVPRLLTDEVIAEATAVQSDGAAWGDGNAAYLRWGMGFMLDSPPGRPFLGASSFGHDGAGGQVAFADPASGVGFAYLTNFMSKNQFDRGTSIVDALKSVLASR